MANLGSKKWTDKDVESDIEKLNYYDAVSTPDLKSSTLVSVDKAAFLKNSIKDEMSAFFLDNSCTALTQIYKANSLWKRIVWLILVSGMLALLVVQCYWLFDKYYKFPTEVKINMKVSSSLEFPSVTICNLNPIMEPKVYSEPYTPLEKYVNPEVSDSLFRETLDNWKFQGDCDNGSFQCDNGQCFDMVNACDGFLDCMQGEDENSCEDYECPIDMWKCTNPPKCIDIALRCDGLAGDCTSHTTEDEENCQNNTCPDTYYKCSTGMCIPDEYLCDQYKDCDDDELNCPNTITAGYGENENTFQATDTTKLSSTTESTSTQSSASTTQHMLTTTQSVATTDASRRRREAPDRPWTGETSDNLKHSLGQRRRYRDGNGIKHSDAVIDSNTVYTDINTLWEASRGSKTRAEFTKELYNSYRTFQMSEISKHKQKAGGSRNAESRKNNEEHRRMKRQVRTTEAPKKKPITVDWKAVFKNSTFNKWDVLNNPSLASHYYEEMTEEYEASMTYAYITATLDPLVVEQSGHLKNDLIASCNFGGHQCSPVNFTYFHSHKYGNCYTFNSKLGNSTNLYTKFPGPENGLTLELFSDQKHYVPFLATEAGIRVLVHRKGTMPFPEDDGISILPGRSTSIGIRQVSFSRLPPPHGVCGVQGKTTDYYGKYRRTEYTKLACMKSCYQDLIIKYCNCAAPIYYVLGNTTVCNMTDTNTELCVDYVFTVRGDSLENCDKMCPISCNETRYELSVSMAKWPSQQYQKFFLQKLGQTNAKYLETQEGDNEFTKLQIYFQDLIYEQVEQQKAYESMSLISDLGGQLGLWLGLSAITIGEICSFLFGVGRSLSYTYLGNKTKPIQDDPTPTTTMQSSTLQEMYEDLCPEAARYTPPERKGPSPS